MGALDHRRVCYFGGQLAGAGGTKLLAMLAQRCGEQRHDCDDRDPGSHDLTQREVLVGDGLYGVRSNARVDLPRDEGS